MALIKPETDDSTQSTDTDFSEVKTETIEIDDSNIFTKPEDMTCGSEGISSIAPVMSEPVDRSLEDWDGCEGAVKKEFDGSESCNELEKPLFVTVKEEPDDETLLVQSTFELSDSTQEELVPVKKEQVYESNESTLLVDQPMGRFQVISNEKTSTSGEATYPEHDECVTHEMGPVTNLNGLVRDACCALKEHPSDGPNCCHHCNSIGTEEVNLDECLIKNGTQCFHKMTLKIKSLTQRVIPLDFVSTSEVERRVYERSDKEGKIQQSDEVQMTEMRNDISDDKNSERILGKRSVAARKEKQSSTSSKQIMQCLSGTELYKCIRCEKTFNKRSNLAKHMCCQTGEKIFKCNQCGKSFTTNSSLTIHNRQHTGEKPFKCNQCKKSFIMNSTLTVHMRHHTGEKPFKCYQCGKSFITKNKLSIHIRQHTGVKPFKCNECGKSFSDNSNLNSHMRQHTGEKPFKCSPCGKAFRDKSNLIIHMRKHTGEKPFKCNECGRSFTQNSSLAVHMQRHRGEKPFQCNQCEKSFTVRNTLTIHMRQHTGEKPFKCNVCKKAYVDKRDLTRHIQTHTSK